MVKETANQRRYFLYRPKVRQHYPFEFLRAARQCHSPSAVVLKVVPYQFIRIEFGRIGWKEEEAKHSFGRLNEFPYFSGSVGWVSINDEEYGVRSTAHQSFQELTEFASIHPSFEHHETHFTFRTDGRYHIDLVSRPCCRHDRSFPNRCPSRTCMIIRTNGRFIRKIDRSACSSCESADLWIRDLSPLINEHRIFLVCVSQRSLRAQSHFLQKTANGHFAQAYVVFFSNQFSHHTARPQGKLELQLERILPHNGLVDPLKLFPLQLGGPPRKWLCPQSFKSAFPALGDPIVDAGSRESQGRDYYFWAFSFFYSLYRSDSDLFQCFVIKRSAILYCYAVSFHNGSSIAYVRLLMKGLITTYNM